MAVLILAGAFYVGRLGAQMRQMHHQTTAAVSQEAKVRKVVVDAGHGGFEMFVILSMGMVNNLIYALMINMGQTQTVDLILEKLASMGHWKRILIWK